MTWIFILGALYGIALILNIKFCQRASDHAGILGSIIGIMVTGLATILALGRNGAQMSPHDWLIPFLALVFFFMPNYVTGAGLLLKD